MDRIDLFIGSKRSQNKKMAPSRVKFGRDPPAISATGVTIARKALAFNSTLRVTNMKACGLWIKSMVKALTGATRAANFDASIQAIGSKTRNMVAVLFSSRIVIDTMATG